ncbi:MAG: FG-GAP-like repeat-containing protein [Prevotellaceae bacterium]|nr:FG-GAP-like repeat-containing protein [Prevotellaceae bacterium]MDY3366461.1 FG-GAP-like repeat-containing protein [Prevotella sp.]
MKPKSLLITCLSVLLSCFGGKLSAQQAHIVSAVDSVSVSSMFSSESILSAVSEVSSLSSAPSNLPNSRYAVGNLKGSLSVSNSGAAIYELPISVPDGGPLTPHISLAYNSQLNGYGQAGYGFNIIGLSSITRCGHDLFHDGQQYGVRYTPDDNLMLDGKRLILQSGSAWQPGSVYTPEGDPYTKVIVHGNHSSSSPDTWFEVKTATGMTYHYGNSTDSRVTYHNKKKIARIASWYISRAEDKYTNYITYKYIVRNFWARPLSITYGTNVAKDRGITNKIQFLYTGLDENSKPFMLEDQHGRIDQCLSAIIITSNNYRYRLYQLIYNDSAPYPKSTDRYTRLSSIEISNGRGEKLPPLSIDWSLLETTDVTNYELDAATKDNPHYVEEKAKMFLAADLTGDGVSDIIRISPVRLVNFKRYETYVYISRSKVSSLGKVSYEDPIIFSIPPFFSIEELKSTIGGTSVMDFDGDGYNDLILTSYSQGENWKDGTFYMILGSDVVAGRGENVAEFTIDLYATDRTPLLATFDSDGNGKDDILCVEQRKKDDYYPSTLVKSKEGKRLEWLEFKIFLPKDPGRMFTGDYNNDGLTDLILLYEGGYKIYYNNGGLPDIPKFTENNVKEGSDFGDYWRVQQGDFDGDGLIDFVYNKKDEYCLWLARNNGDGTFSHTQTGDTGVGEHASSKDDDKFTMLVYDMNRDGRSDVMLCKSAYRYRGFPRFRYDYKETPVRWLYSTGTNLTVAKKLLKYREEDARETNIFLGDFDGDGYVELANYGSKLNSTDDTFDESIHVYKTGEYSPHTGKAIKFTDSFGKEDKIHYAYATNPKVYKKSNSRTHYPVNTYTLPLSVVSTTMVNIGGKRNTQVNYTYEDLRLHIGGRGMLGFNTMVKDNITLKTKDSISINHWDEERWIPIETATISTVGSSSSTTISTSTIQSIGNNYFAYTSRKELTDLDGNHVTTFTVYDTKKGVVAEETVKNDGDNMYKKVSYSNYENKGGVWLPTILTKTQKHADDSTPYTSVTTYSYDERGNILSAIENDGTSMSLQTTSTYDVYGNVLSSETMGYGVVPITHHNEYDATGRFVVKKYTSPETSVNTFTYDHWGNVLTEKDETDASNILATTHTYDGWNRKLSTVAADGIRTDYEMGWSANWPEKYYVKAVTKGKPIVRTGYDNGENKVTQLSTGLKDVPIAHSFYYNPQGMLGAETSKVGDLFVLRGYDYDERGRKIADKIVGDTKKTYSYGKRSVTTTVAGRSVTQEMDAWGNVIKTSDPAGEMTYTYNSNGKPSSCTAYGVTTQMTYDEVGNQISLIDPNAGTQTYEYAADGTLLKQTDGRGIETINTYDELGRLASIKIGRYVITHTYGTAGNAKMRLVKKTMNNGTAIEYGYDRLGRVITERRLSDTRGEFNFAYEYDTNNHLIKETYPGGLEVHHTYDDKGFRMQTTIGDKVVYKVEDYNGLKLKTSFMNEFVSSQTHDKKGYLTNLQLTHRDVVLENLDMTYNIITDNLLSRKRNDKPQESFEYDDMDRLVAVRQGETETMRMRYAPNGNIMSKTDIGNYYYDDSEKPHAVVEVDNEADEIRHLPFHTDFNDFGKIDMMLDEHRNTQRSFYYGPDMERWFSSLYHNHQFIGNIIYANNYELRTNYNNEAREYYFLDNNVIVIKENGEVKPYLVFKDNLGSFLSVMDETGEKVYQAYYDVWGRLDKQEDNYDFLDIRRGYTGHEMLEEFNIINMNGRLYDPYLGRFFSPDTYVQFPYDGQNFNRYSYCLNNPLKYTDPSGDFFEIAAFALFNMASSMMMASFNGENVWKAGALSVLSSAASFGIGAAFGNVGSFGNELLRAGVHGVSSGVFTALDGGNFGSGFLSGALASGMGSYAQGVNMGTGWMLASTSGMGGLAAWATGGDFLQGAMRGMTIGLFNHAMHDSKNVMGCSATCEVLPNDMFEALEPLNEVNVIGRRILKLPRTAFLEKPLEMFSPEFAILFTGRAIANGILQMIWNLRTIKTYSVYFGRDESGIIRYVGITKRDPLIRFKEHLNSDGLTSTLRFKEIKGKYSYREARRLEQMYINKYRLQKHGGQLYNKINSIAPKRWDEYGITP